MSAAPATIVSHTPGLPDPASEVKYTCGACMMVQSLPTGAAGGPLMCHYCSNRNGSSKVFFKVRTEPTDYDTR